MMTIWIKLKKFDLKIKEILKDQYVGTYLHGSLAMGCFHPEKSDVDCLCVVHHDLTMDQKEKLMKVIFALHQCILNGLEISVIKKEYCQNFVYPTPYELHFSKMYTSQYMQNPMKYIATMHGTDKDLAAHMTIIYHFGKVIGGQNIKDVFCPVPEKYYLESLYYDMASYMYDVENQPMYVILSLCRILAYVKSHLYLSKEQGALYALKFLPEKNYPIILQALSCYRGNQTMQVNDEIRLFVKNVSYMIQNNQ